MTMSKAAGEGAEAASGFGTDEVPEEAPAQAAVSASRVAPPAMPGDPAVAQASAGPPPASFELARTELEALVARMEDGRLPLEESLAAYQRGVVLVKYCRDTLGQVSRQVRILEADLLQPFVESLGNDRDA